MLTVVCRFCRSSFQRFDVAAWHFDVCPKREEFNTRLWLSQTAERVAERVN